MTERLTIATLNIWNNSGPWSARRDLIRRQLAELRPDLIGLQEVMRLTEDGRSVLTPEADQATDIAHGLGYEIAYAAAMHYGNGLEFGNALLSLHPIREHAGIGLPREGTDENRVMLYALVETPAGLLPTFVTHLNWKLHHGRVRLAQVRFLVDEIFERAPIDETRLPPVVMGDFNADPESDEIRYMVGRATVGDRSVYFADAWTYGGDGGPGYTFDRRNRFAALSHEPPRRIDYIFVRGPDRQLRGEPLETRLAFASSEPDESGELWPSDHFGVVTEIAVSPRSP